MSHRENDLNLRGVFLNLGGTIGEVYDGNGQLRRLDGGTLLDAAKLSGLWSANDISVVDSADMTFEALFKVKDVIAQDSQSRGFIMCCGTDLLEEIAFAASLILPLDRPVILTAASLPHSAVGSDGPANLRRAAQLASSLDGPGFYVVMGDSIFDPALVVKIDAEGMQPFGALDGPAGRFRVERPSIFDVHKAEDEFRDLSAQDCTARVGIVTMCLGGDYDFVDPGRLDGLVVAGAGAGGLSAGMLDTLRRKFLPAMPVVLSTRCPFGFSINPAVAKYAQKAARDDGFILDGYTHLSAPKARIRLMLEIGRDKRTRT